MSSISFQSNSSDKLVVKFGATLAKLRAAVHIIVVVPRQDSGVGDGENTADSIDESRGAVVGRAVRLSDNDTRGVKAEMIEVARNAEEGAALGVGLEPADIRASQTGEHG